MKALAIALMFSAALMLQCASGSWPRPDSMRPTATTNATYAEYIHLFALATKLSYTATSGGYYNPAAANATIPGWAKVAEANPNVGMRAIAFNDAASNRLLIAFRGTDLTNCRGGHADVCADMMLWDGVPFDALPASLCSNFSAGTLDYFGQARKFVQSVAAAYPASQIMTTGHSLGFGLAVLIAALAQAPTTSVGCGVPSSVFGAVGFATPGAVETLLNRTAVNVSSLDSTRFLVFADQWDPVYYAASLPTANITTSGLVGNVCLYKNGTQGPFCSACESGGAKLPLPGSTVCDICMLERHAFSHYLGLINAGVTPMCTTRPVNGCLRPGDACVGHSGGSCR